LDEHFSKMAAETDPHKSSEITKNLLPATLQLIDTYASFTRCDELPTWVVWVVLILSRSPKVVAVYIFSFFLIYHLEGFPHLAYSLRWGPLNDF
jgi:hypothetical protein